MKKIFKMLIRNPAIFHFLFMTMIKLIMSFRDVSKKKTSWKNQYSKWQTRQGCVSDWEPEHGIWVTLSLNWQT
jgi:hypothetical protein